MFASATQGGHNKDIHTRRRLENGKTSGKRRENVGDVVRALTGGPDNEEKCCSRLPIM